MYKHYIAYTILLIASGVLQWFIPSLYIFPITLFTISLFEAFTLYLNAKLDISTKQEDKRFEDLSNEIKKISDTVSKHELQLGFKRKD